MAQRTQLSFEIDPELLRRLKIVTAKKGSSVSKVLREFVHWYVEKEERNE